MTKKQESLLGLPSVSQFPGATSNSLVPFTSGGPLTKDDQRMLAEFRKEMAVIEATAFKTEFGMAKIGEIHEHAATEFDSTVGFILAVKDEPRGKEHQLYVDEFTARQIQMLARHILGAVEVGATNIGIEINRTLYFASEPERRGFLRRLFGG